MSCLEKKKPLRGCDEGRKERASLKGGSFIRLVVDLPRLRRAFLDKSMKNYLEPSVVVALDDVPDDESYHPDPKESVPVNVFKVEHDGILICGKKEG